MDYKLAKKLKDAGFPFQRWSGAGRVVYENIVENPDGTIETLGIPMKVPTLSELIAACGEDFQKLETIVDKKWQGVGGKGIRDIETEGNTPEEAVSLLWLALRK